MIFNEAQILQYCQDLSKIKISCHLRWKLITGFDPHGKCLTIGWSRRLVFHKFIEVNTCWTIHICINAYLWRRRGYVWSYVHSLRSRYEQLGELLSASVSSSSSSSSTILIYTPSFLPLPFWLTPIPFAVLLFSWRRDETYKIRESGEVRKKGSFFAFIYIKWWVY